MQCCRSVNLLAPARKENIFEALQDEDGDSDADSYDSLIDNEESSDTESIESDESDSQEGSGSDGDMRQNEKAVLQDHVLRTARIVALQRIS